MLKTYLKNNSDNPVFAELSFQHLIKSGMTVGTLVLVEDNGKISTFTSVAKLNPKDINFSRPIGRLSAFDKLIGMVDGWESKVHGTAGIIGDELIKLYNKTVNQKWVYELDVLKRLGW